MKSQRALLKTNPLLCLRTWGARWNGRPALALPRLLGIPPTAGGPAGEATVQQGAGETCWGFRVQDIPALIKGPLLADLGSTKQTSDRAGAGVRAEGTAGCETKWSSSSALLKSVFLQKKINAGETQELFPGIMFEKVIGEFKKQNCQNMWM